MRRRHPNVGHHQFRSVLTNDRQQLRTITGLAHNIETRTIQQAGQPLPKQQIVLGYNDPQRRRCGPEQGHRGRGVLIGALFFSCGGHGHLIDGEAVAALGFSQLDS